MRDMSFGTQPIGIVLWIMLFLVSAPWHAWSQDEAKFIGEIRVMNVVEAECNRKDDKFEIRFKDARNSRFPKYKTFHFKDEDKNYYKLKKLVMDGFKNVPEEPVLTDFTEEKIELHFTKSAGIVSFRFALVQGKKDKRTFSSWFSKGKAEKLFGI